MGLFGVSKGRHEAAYLRKSEATGKYNADAHVAKQCKDSTEKNRSRGSGKSGRK